MFIILPHLKMSTCNFHLGEWEKHLMILWQLNSFHVMYCAFMLKSKGGITLM